MSWLNAFPSVLLLRPLLLPLLLLLVLRASMLKAMRGSMGPRPYWTPCRFFVRPPNPTHFAVVAVLQMTRLHHVVIREKPRSKGRLLQTSRRRLSCASTTLDRVFWRRPFFICRPAFFLFGRTRTRGSLVFLLNTAAVRAAAAEG